MHIRGMESQCTPKGSPTPVTAMHTCKPSASAPPSVASQKADLKSSVSSLTPCRSRSWSLSASKHELQLCAPLLAGKGGGCDVVFCPCEGCSGSTIPKACRHVLISPAQLPCWGKGVPSSHGAAMSG